MGSSRMPVSLRNTFAVTRSGSQGSNFALGRDLSVFQDKCNICSLLMNVQSYQSSIRSLCPQMDP